MTQEPKESWEKELEAVWNRAGLHLGYKNHKVEVIKEFIRSFRLMVIDETMKGLQKEWLYRRDLYKGGVPKGVIDNLVGGINDKK